MVIQNSSVILLFLILSLSIHGYILFSKKGSHDVWLIRGHDTNFPVFCVV